MSIKNQLAFAFICFVSTIVLGQNDTIYPLKEIIIADSHIKDFTTTQKTNILSDSILKKNPVSLSQLLRYTSTIYFKENGLGMVASPSFRGTTAQQTAVIWNSININSQLNGQTDFNTLTSQGFDEIVVKSGGGSVLYGSSAIGGSIHLNNQLIFEKSFRNTIRASYGSFNTYITQYEVQASDKSFSTVVSFSRNASENDYEYIGKNKKNENGNYFNNSLNTTVGYKINENNTVALYSQFWDSERHFSGTVSSPSRSKYDDFNTRNLLEWNRSFSNFTSSLKTAYLTEKYKYFENKNNDFYESSEVKTFIAKYDITYPISSNLKVNFIADFTHNQGEGNSIAHETRNIYSVSGLVKHRVSNKFLYEISVRKETSDVFDSPFLFSIGTNYAFNKHYTTKFSISKNYRIPTYNDLFWQGSGNPDLKPESAIQLDFGNEFKFKNTTFDITGFYSKITDMLRWIPNYGTIWQPENTENVTIYGLESTINWKKTFGNHYIQLNGNYSYTISLNEKTDKQLIYVPYHIANASAAYYYKKMGITYQLLFNGQVFTSSDNAYFLKEYSVSNIRIDYNLDKIFPARLGVTLGNIYNEYYENVTARPMPGRYFMFNLILTL
jgi:vitamin B12 transporter